MNELDYLALSRLPDEEFPTRVSRIKIRKGEDFAAWRERAIQYRKENPPNVKATGDPLKERFGESLQSAKDYFQLTDEDLERYADPDPKMPAAAALVTETWKMQNADGKPMTRADQDGLFELRAAMFDWVEKTYTRKLSEAICDLDCFNCPGGVLLNCAAQNRSSVEEDGIATPDWLQPAPTEGGDP